MTAKQIILGLDLGLHSIGSNLIRNDEKGHPKEILAMNTRIFSKVIDEKGIPLNQKRRIHRSARKTISRRKMRKDNLKDLLVETGFLPSDFQQDDSVASLELLGDPYKLRARALLEPVSPQQFARILLHLVQRRGFKSNRKTTRKEDGKVLAGISRIETSMKNAKTRTLGQYLASLPATDQDGIAVKKRGIYTHRDMFEYEFEQLWETQSAFSSDMLTCSLKEKVKRQLFFQRPLKIQKNLVGGCSFERHRKRLARASLEWQEFRIRQDINHLSVKDPVSREYRLLDAEERNILYQTLQKQKTLSWGQARKKLGLHGGELFNLEEGRKSKLFGNQTSCILRKAIGSNWDVFRPSKQESLITDLLTIHEETGLRKRLGEHWTFDPSTIDKVVECDLEPGYGNLSRKAVKKILPFLEEGMNYREACEAAGYFKKDQGIDALPFLPEPPEIRNPVVSKALHQTRKVVNAYIRAYGKPDCIRVELARDLKLSRQKKIEVHSAMKQRENKNQKVVKILNNEFAEFENKHPSRKDIVKYLLWEECKCVCPYTGEPISKSMLYTNQVNVEHILPYSRSLDNSFNNKTLCLAEENILVKRNHTPYEAYAGDRSKYDKILQRVSDFPSFSKRRKFEQKEISLDNSITRHLNDTRYISREVSKYLKCLGLPVQVGNGRLTSILRYRWGLNNVIPGGAPNKKNRDDHRHHAVDALLVALTSPRLMQRFARISEECDDVPIEDREFDLPEPWAGFREDVRSHVEGIVVSHQMNRKILGALHEDTVYGYNKKEGKFICRKKLQDLKERMLQPGVIRDNAVRELVLERLARFDNNPKKAFTEDNPLFHKDGKTKIETVRINAYLSVKSVVGFPSKNPYKYFKTGKNHHVEIIEDIKTGTWSGVFVKTLEAAQRARIRKAPVVKRDHGEGKRFVMSLMINDTVVIKENGQKKVYRVQKMSGPNNSIIFRKHFVNVKSDKDSYGVLRKTPSTLKALNPEKAIVDPLGRISPCND